MSTVTTGTASAAVRAAKQGSSAAKTRAPSSGSASSYGCPRSSERDRGGPADQDRAGTGDHVVTGTDDGQGDHGLPAVLVAIVRSDDGAANEEGSLRQEDAGVLHDDDR